MDSVSYYYTYQPAVIQSDRISHRVCFYVEDSWHPYGEIVFAFLMQRRVCPLVGRKVACTNCAL